MKKLILSILLLILMLSSVNALYLSRDTKMTANNTYIYITGKKINFNDTILNQKMNISDQRYNDTVLINTKLDITDQRYNDSLRIDSVNSSLISNVQALNASINGISLNIYNDSWINGTIDSKVLVVDNKYSTIGNWSADKSNYNTTNQLNSLYYSQNGGNINGNVNIIGNLTILGSFINANVTNLNMKGNILPDLNNTFTLGDSNNIWSNIYGFIDYKYILNSPLDNINQSLNQIINDVNASLNGEILARTSIGNWSNDKNNYNTTNQLVNLFYSVTNPNNYITDGNTNWDNSYGFITTTNLTNYTPQIQSVNNSLNNEITNRQNNDTLLQNNINAKLDITDQRYNDTTYINNNYYNQSTSDSRFVNVAGDSMTGTLGVDNINFSQTPTITCANATVGQLFYDVTDKALSYKVNGICLQIGEEMYISATNKLGFQINNGQAVYINGAQGSQATVNLTNANSEASSYVIGLATQDCGINAQCKFTISGLVHDIDTSAWIEGTRLYISTQSGNLTSTRPLAPLHGAFVGTVIYQHLNQGIILVTPRNGYELDELHDVYISSSTNNDVLQWNGTVWKNVAPYWLNATDQRYNETGLINAINTSDNIIQLYATIQRDPQGFPDLTNTNANLNNVLRFNDATRNFTITPVGANFTFYVKGKLITKTSVQNLVINNTDGKHIIYFDVNGNLQETAVLTDDILCNNAIVAIVFWQVQQGRKLMMNDERHTRYMECEVHSYLHEHFGTQYDSGLSPTNLSVGGSTSLNTSAQIASTAGAISDEDYQHDINAYVFPGNYRVYYQLGATGNWSFKQDNYPFIYSGDGTYTGAGGRIAYNLNTGGVWSLTEATSTNFVLFHVFSTNSFNSSTDMIVVEGQAQYTSSTLATTGAQTEINSIRTTGLFSSEYKPLYTFILQTNTAWTNRPKAIIQQPSTGGQFIDWRTSNLNGATGTSVGGTVTLVDSGTGLTGGPITSTGILSIDNTYIQQFNETLRIDSINSSLQSEINNRFNNDSNIVTLFSNNDSVLNNKITSLGNWSADKSSYTLLTYTQSLGNWSADKASYTLLNTFNTIGNWSADKSNYYNKTETNNYYNYSIAISNLQSANVTANSRIDSVNSSLQSEISARQSIGNWSADKSNYNTTAQNNNLYYLITNPSNFYNSTTIPSYALLTYVQSLGNWSADKSSYTLLTTFNTVGNWSADKTNYMNTTTLYSTFTNKTYADANYLVTANYTTLNNKITSIGNWSADKSGYMTVGTNIFNQTLNTTSNVVFNTLNITNDVKFDNGSVYFNSTNNVLTTANITMTGSLSMPNYKWYQGFWYNGMFTGSCYNGTNATNGVIIVGTSFNATAQGCSQ